MIKNSDIDYTFLAGLKTQSKTSTNLKRVIRKILYFNMKQKKLTDTERKADTRMKIMMGGLIKKAGLDFLHPDKADVLYGMLLDNKKSLETNPTITQKWQKLGRDLSAISKNYGKIL